MSFAVHPQEGKGFPTSKRALAGSGGALDRRLASHKGPWLALGHAATRVLGSGSDAGQRCSAYESSPCAALLGLSKSLRSAPQHRHCSDADVWAAFFACAVVRHSSLVTRRSSLVPTLVSSTAQRPNEAAAAAFIRPRPISLNLGCSARPQYPSSLSASSSCCYPLQLNILPPLDHFYLV